MPYLLHPRGDGEAPGWSLVSDAYEPAAGEVLLDEMPDPGLVWDETTNALREKGDAERLEEAKAEKLGELADAAIDSLAPMFTPGAGRDETALLIAGHVLKVCEALKIPLDPRLTAVVETGQKALAKKAEVEAATTEAEVEAVAWT